jgi:tRNA pseudouridine55 synthase
LNAPRSTRVEVNGWVVLDKPAGLTSTQAVSKLKRLFNAKKAGHAGTLDPLASGVLPVAFGEATKTVPFVQEGEKAYRFTVQWGAETDTDDAEGKITQTSGARPDSDAIAALLPRFTGEIMQRPPSFSAIKVNGERAYDLAREGEIVDLAPRPIAVHALRLIASEADRAVLEAECGKGTYVRAIARDLGRALGCFGHVTALRRTRVGPFHEQYSARLAELLDAPERANEHMLGVESGLTELPCVVLDRNAAARLRRGQSVILRGRDAPEEGAAYAVCSGVVIASGVVEQGEFLPNRVFNLPF